MGLRAAGLALLAALALAGCGEAEDGGEAARHLDPRSDAVLALDLDYDGDNWEQIKQLYARAIESDAFDDDGFVPPALPGVLEALQGLGSTGLTGLLFVAPDAPLTPAAFGLLAAVRVTRLAGGGDEQLYEVTGLDERGFRPGPNRVVYGLVGDVFVVASSPELAREVAAMATEPAAEAATRLRVDVGALVEYVSAELGGDEDADVVGELLERAEASASAQDGDIVADAELVWAR